LGLILGSAASGLFRELQGCTKATNEVQFHKNTPEKQQAPAAASRFAKPDADA